MAYQRTLAFSAGTSNTGLADLRAQLMTTAGADTGAAISSGFFEIGRGLYGWNYAAFTDDFRGFVRFYSNAAPSTPLAAVEVNPQDYEYLDVKVSTRAAGASALDAAAVWSYATRTLTMTAAEVEAVLAGSDLVLVRGTTVSIAFTGLGSLAGRTKLWFTAKRRAGDTDALAVIQIEESAGLLYLDGNSPTAGDGVLAVTDAAAGNGTITLKPAASRLLVVEQDLVWDIKSLIGTTVSQETAGTLEVTADITRAVS